MLQQSFKQIFRSLWRYKSFSFINLSGLSIGIAAVLLLLMLADYERDFDNFHNDKEQIYRVVSKRARESQLAFQATVPYTVGRLLRAELKDIPATEIHYVKDLSLRIGNTEPIKATNILFADSMFFEVFNFGKIPDFWVRGSRENFLTKPNQAILTESTAKRFFSNQDPIGRLIRLDNKQDVEVTGIIKDVPATTHLPFNMLVTFSTVTKDFLGGLDPQQWGIRSNGYCYVRLPGDVSEVNNVLSAIVKQHAYSEDDKKEVMYLQNLKQIHFDTAFETSNPSYTITENYISLLLMLGAFIIMIACINYINLSTSLAFSKSKEVGIRKTIGASRPQLFCHYVSETILLTSIAAIVALGLAALSIPAVNELLGKSISLKQLLQPEYVLIGVAGLLFVSLVSGFYPALVLSGFHPIESLKTSVSIPGRFSTALRKGLVAFQFSISIALIICTVVFARQTNYFNAKPLGFDKDAIIEVDLPVNDSAKITSFHALLQNNAGIKKMSFCIGAPISENGLGTSLWRSDVPESNELINIIAADSNYLSTYGIQLMAGRWFLPSESLYRDSATAIVVNETLIKTLGFKSPSDAIGKKITIGINDLNLPIIGVTRNFHTSSLHQSIKPVGIIPFSFFYYAAAIRIEPASLKPTLSKIAAAWKRTYPESVYAYKFIDETLATQYAQESKDYKLFKAFSAISIFICCIGLWGLIAFTVARKTKEIGVRKVLGASILGIIGLLCKDFLKLTSVALLIASPIAWYFMNQWLQNFAYRISISWWMFPLAGIIAIGIAFLTIATQAIKAAVANPIKSLRTE